VVPGLPLLGNGLAMRRDSWPSSPASTVSWARSSEYALRAAGSCASRGRSGQFPDLARKDRFPVAGADGELPQPDGFVALDPDHGRDRSVTTRKAQANGYAVRILKDRSQEVVDITRDEIGKWPVGKPFEVLPAFQHLIAEQMGHMMAGYSPEGYTRDLSTLLGGLLLGAATVPHVMKLARFRRARERARELARAVLAHKSKVGPRRTTPDFIDLMLELREADPQLLPETNLPLTVLAPYMVGLDTTASTCSFMIYNVLKRPRIMERMTAEADAMFDRAA